MTGGGASLGSMAPRPRGSPRRVLAGLLAGGLVVGPSLGLGGCGQLDRRIDTIEHRQSEQGEARQEHAQQLEAHDEALVAANQRIDNLEKRLATAETEGVARAERVASLEQQVADLQARADELELELTELRTHKSLTVGVPECDDYIAKYNHCIDDRLPDEVRETSRRALETTVQAWRAAARTEAGREGLVAACKTAMEAVAASCGFGRESGR